LIGIDSSALLGSSSNKDVVEATMKDNKVNDDWIFSIIVMDDEKLVIEVGINQM